MYANPLGATPTVVTKAIDIVENWLSVGGYQGGLSAESQQVDTWVRAVANDLALRTAAGQTAWMYLRCWANDPGAVNTSVANAAPCTGCGDGGHSGGLGRCQQYAAQAVAYLKQHMTQAAAESSPVVDPSGSVTYPTSAAPGSVSPVVLLLGAGALFLLTRNRSH